MEIDYNWQQPRGDGIIVLFNVSFNISVHIEHEKDGRFTNGTRVSFLRVPHFAQDRTLFPARVEEACRHEEGWNHLTCTDFLDEAKPGSR